MNQSGLGGGVAMAAVSDGASRTTGLIANKLERTKRGDNIGSINMPHMFLLHMDILHLPPTC